MASVLFPGKYFCFTWNNYPEGYEQQLADVFGDLGFTYLCYAEEVAPTTGTPHIQGYVEFGKKLRVNTKKVREALPGIHYENRRGSAVQNREYIKGPYVNGDKVKPENPSFKEVGDISGPVQGPRTSVISDVCEQLREGVSLQQIAVEHPTLWVQFGNRFRDYLGTVLPDRDDPPFEVIHIISLVPYRSVERMLLRRFPGAYVYNNCDWRGYRQQETVIFPVRGDGCNDPEVVQDALSSCRIQAGACYFNSPRVIYFGESEFTGTTKTIRILPGEQLDKNL